jgi:hypothetical protein
VLAGAADREPFDRVQEVRRRTVGMPPRSHCPLPPSSGWLNWAMPPRPSATASHSACAASGPTSWRLAMVLNASTAGPWRRSGTSTSKSGRCALGLD